MRVAIAEDHQPDAALLEQHLYRYGEEKQLNISVDIFTSGEALLKEYEKGRWDLLLLDVEMDHMDGIEAGEKIRKMDEDVLIMYITYTPQYAAEAFNVMALDYMVKPVEYEVFLLKMDRAKKFAERGQRQKLKVQNSDGIRMIEIREIRYIEVQDHTVSYHLEDEVVSTVGGKTLNELERDLEWHNFARCNRCYLVNLRYAIEMRKDHLYMEDSVLKVSRTYKKDFVSKMVEYWGM